MIWTCPAKQPEMVSSQLAGCAWPGCYVFKVDVIIIIQVDFGPITTEMWVKSNISEPIQQKLQTAKTWNNHGVVL